MGFVPEGLDDVRENLEGIFLRRLACGQDFAIFRTQAENDIFSEPFAGGWPSAEADFQCSSRRLFKNDFFSVFAEHAIENVHWMFGHQTCDKSVGRAAVHFERRSGLFDCRQVAAA